VSLTLGTRLGPYEIGAQIGVGGMGVVYRATDTNLKRQVAIKVLPDAVAADAERVARFQREAEVLASLSHPNIAIIHGLQRGDGVIALVMELVEGPTLADRIARGPIPIDEALQIAAQIAEALESAHEQRVIHRDLKPANIKLRPDGTVKVLDFGLAKALEPIPDVSASLSHSPTITTAMTQPGVILGTAVYMAPEQARGAAVDQRADIWAFGCVLYEMLAGRTAFGGATVSETVARILEGRPDLDALPSSTPVAMRRLVRRCLERPVRTRLQHIGDALADIVDVRSGESSVAGLAATRSPPRSRAIIWAVASVGLVMLGAAVAWFLSSQLAPAVTAVVPIRFDVQRVQGEPIGPITRHLALSPDGTRLAYATVSSLRLRAMGGEDVPLPETGTQPFFSPDNKWLAFFSDEGLKRLPVGGGASEPITPATGTERVFGGTWGTDGTIVISLGGRLLQVSAQGGSIQPVAEPDPTRGEVRFAWPEFLPDGRSLLFTIIGEAGAADARVAVLDLATRRTTQVLQGGHAARYLRTGHLLYASQGRLHVVAFDVRALQTRGVPVTFEGMNIATTAGGFNANFAVSDNGTLAYLPPVGPRIRTLVWVDRNGLEEAIPAPAMEYVYPRISPDGTRVALDVGGRNRDIWVGNLASGVVTKITDGPTEDLMPAWSPDSTRVFFASDREGGAFRVFSVAADGAGAVRQEFAGKGNFMPLSMPAPDQLIAFASGEGTRGGDIAIVTIGGGAQPPKVLGMERQQGNAQVSPDGRWIAYQSGESGTEEVYVRSYPDVDRRREQISIGGGLQPLWGRPGANDLFYWDLKGRLKVVSVATTDDLRVGPSRDVPIAEGVDRPIVGSAWVYAVSPLDGRFLMFKLVSSGGALVPFKVIVNWFEELKRLVPTK
jgi:serine/threonine protein kinase/dipeptidyl aminopeptidase/acylaminoacyl peptidase